MTEQTQLTTNTPPPIRGGPFTINLLNTILAFAAADERDVFLCYTLVCKQWREAEMYYCQEMWKHLSLKKFSRRPRAHRFSHWSFVKKARGFLSSIAGDTDKNYTKILAHSDLLNEVENCHDPEFAFRCPMLLRNMRELENEVVRGRNVLFCDVCEKRVYPISHPGEIEFLPPSASIFGPSSSNEQKQEVHLEERRCIIINRKSFDDPVAYRRQKKGTPFYKNYYGEEGPFNIAIVTSEPPPPPEGRERGIGESVLKQLVHSLAGAQSRYADVNTNNNNNTTKTTTPSSSKRRSSANQQQEEEEEKETIDQRAILPMFLSKDSCHMILKNYDNCPVHIRVVRVPPAPKDMSPDFYKKAFADPYPIPYVQENDDDVENNNALYTQTKTKVHPFSPNGALGEGHMPTKNGWNMVIVADKNCAGWFQEDCYPKGTPVGALLAATKHEQEEMRSQRGSVKFKSITKDENNQRRTFVAHFPPFHMPLSKQEYEEQEQKRIDLMIARETGAELDTSSSLPPLKKGASAHEVKEWQKKRDALKLEREKAELEQRKREREQFYFGWVRTRDNFEKRVGDLRKEMESVRKSVFFQQPQQQSDTKVATASNQNDDQEDNEKSEKEKDQFERDEGALYSRALKELYLDNIVCAIWNNIYDFTETPRLMGDTRGW